uniref:TOG domain-containing protein n=2 Tax=Tetraodon nigroviridis TaxID=99883 RepID=H3BZE2_TETNG
MDDALQTMTQSQTFSDVRSSSPEIFGLQEPSYIDTPLASVSQLSLKAQVKDMSYLPVLHYRSKAEKKLVAGIRLQYVSPQMEKVFGRIQSRFQETMSLAESSGPGEAEVMAPQPSPFQMKRYQKQHSVVGKPTVKVVPVCPAPQQGHQFGATYAATFPPTDPAPQTCREACARSKQNQDSRSFQNSRRKYLGNCEELIRPSNAKTVLLSALKNLSSNDWTKHTEGLLQIRALAQEHPTVLAESLQQVCVEIGTEISSNRSAVSCEAMETMGVLYEHLQSDMDRLVALTGTPLLVRFASLKGLRERATNALEKMVDYCNPKKVLDFLLSKGLSHGSCAVRDGTAYLLIQLAEKMGITKVLKSKNFIIAVTKMCLDSSPTTRAHGYALLHDMNNEAGTEKLLSLIDAKNRSRIEINLKKTRKQSRGWG